MNKVQQKPNDIFIATVNAPDASILDLYRSNITAENTSLLEADEYMNTPFVKKHFTKDGVFDQESFTAAYTKAQQNYQDLADQQSYEGLEKYLEYDIDNVYRPKDAKIRDNSFSFQKEYNPLHQSIGSQGLNVISEPLKTEKETAQGNRIWDTEKGKWLDYTPEDQNIFKKMFGQTLKYAKYQYDGEQVNPVTGEVGYHRKGEWMTDENGNYFTATLGKQQKGHDDIVVIGDILTKEYSPWNKFDFWDSDGYDKSLGGIAMKAFVNILPYLTPLRGYYGAFTALTGLVSTMPILYKNLESLILGEEQTGMTEAMTQLENWFYKWDSSKSYKGSQGFWNVENLGQLISDTFGQLYQQRAAAALAPKVLKRFDTRLAKVAKYRELTAAGKSADEAAKLVGLTGKQLIEGGKRLNDISTRFALGYMGLVHTADMYNEAIKAGYDRRTAGIVGLASMGALYGVMRFNSTKNGLGTWFLDKTTGFDEHVSRGAMMKLAKEELRDLMKQIQKAVSSNDKHAMAYAIREWKRKGASALHDAFVIGGEDIWKGMIVEGVEEVTEEIVQDAIKGMADTMSWLGWTSKEGSFGGWDNVFSKRGLERYLSVFVGGAIGGGLFKAQDKWINPLVDNVFSSQPVSQKKEEIYTITKVILDGRFDEYIKALKDGKKYIHNALDSSSFGNGETLGTKGESQADVAVKTAIAKAYSIKAMLEGAVGNFSTLSDFEKQYVASNMAKILEDNDFAKDYLNSQFNDAAGRVAELTQAYTELKQQDNLTAEQKQELENIKGQLDLAVEHFKGFFSGANFNMSVIQGKLLQDPSFIDAFMYTDIDSLSKDVYDVVYSELPDNDPLKKVISDEYKVISENYTEHNFKQLLPVVSKVIIKLASKTAGNFKAFSANEKAKQVLQYIHSVNPRGVKTMEQFTHDAIKQEVDDGTLNPEQANAFMDRVVSESLDARIHTLAKVNPEKFAIQARYDFDLASQIEGSLEFVGMNDEQKAIAMEMINEYARRSHVQRWSARHVHELINSVNEKLLNMSNAYTSSIYYLDDRDPSTGDMENVHIELKDVSTLPELSMVKINSLMDFLDQANVSENANDSIDSELLNDLAIQLYSEAKDLAYAVAPEIDQIANNESISTSEKLAKLAEELSVTLDTGDIEASNIEQVENLINILNTLSQKTVIENQIVQALKAMYRYINHGSQGEDIFTWIASRNAMNSRSDLSGLQKELENSDKETIKNAYRAINVLANIIRVSTETIYDSIIESGGLIDYVREYARLSGMDQSLFHSLTKEEARIALQYLQDLVQRLDSFDLLNQSFKLSKHEEDLSNRRIQTIGFAHALLSKEFIIGDRKIVGRTDIPEDENECEKAIEERLDEVREAYLAWKKEDPSHTVEEFINILNNSIHFNPKTDNICSVANKLFAWDSVTGKVEEDKFYLLKRLSLTAIVDRTQIQTDLKDILSQDGQAIFPKYDQQLAMEELLYRAYDVKQGNNVMNTLLTMFHDENKPVLHNTSVIFGTPGSGKSFVLMIMKKKLTDILGKEFVAASATAKNAEDMHTKLGVESSLINPFLNNLKEGLGDLATNVNDLFVQFASLWNKIQDDEAVTTVPQADGSRRALTGKELYAALLKGLEAKINENEDLKDAITFTANEDTHMFTITVKVNDKEFTLSSKFAQIINNEIKFNYDIRYVVSKLPVGLLNGVILDNNIVVDEVTLTSPAHISILQQLVHQHGRMLALAGDYRQQSLTAQVGTMRTNLSPMLSYSYLSTPVFTGSYRFTSNLSTENLNGLLKIIDKFEGDIPVQNEKKYLPNDLVTLKQKFQELKLQWQQLLESNIFIGQKIVSTSEQFLSDLNTLILNQVQPTTTIAVITETGPDADIIKTALSAKGIPDSQVTYIDAGNVQGGEYDYVVAYNLTGYKMGDNDDTELNFPKAYTTLSRGKFGALIYDTPTGLFASTGISSNEQPSIDGYLYQEEASNASEDRISKIEEILRILKKAPEAPTKPASHSSGDLPSNIKEEPEMPIEHFFKDASILQSWYVRLGVEKNDVDPAGLKTVKEFEDQGVTSVDDDLIAFIEAKREAGEYTDYTKMSDIAADFFEYRMQITNELANPDSEWHKKGRKWRFKKKVADQTVDWPYEKFNENIKWDENPTFSLIQIQTDEGYWITVGKLGYNLDADDKSISQTQENIFTQAAEQNDIVEFVFDQESNLLDEIRQEVLDYRRKRRTQLGERNVGTFGLVRYQNLRDLWLNNSDPICYENNKKIGIAEDDLKFNRLTLYRLMQHGYVLDPSDPNVVWDPTKNNDFEAFKDWYTEGNYFWPDDADNTFKGLERRVWVRLRQKGSNYTKPILINRVFTGDFLADEDSSFRKEGTSNTTWWGAWQLGRFVGHIMRTTVTDPTTIQAINNEFREGTQVYEIVSALLKNEDIKDALIKEIHEVVPDITNDDALEASLEHFVELLTQVFTEGAEPVKADQFMEIEWLYGLIKSDKYKKFFYHNQTNSIDIATLQDTGSLQNWVATRFIEPFNFFINWRSVKLDITLPVDTQEGKLQGMLQCTSMDQIQEALTLVQTLVDPSINSLDLLESYLDKTHVTLADLQQANSQAGDIRERISNAKTDSELNQIRDYFINNISSNFKELQIQLSTEVSIKRADLEKKASIDISADITKIVSQIESQDKSLEEKMVLKTVALLEAFSEWGTEMVASNAEIIADTFKNLGAFVIEESIVGDLYLANQDFLLNKVYPLTNKDVATKVVEDILTELNKQNCY